MQPISQRNILRYLRLEEDDDTLDLLRPGSLCYLGAHSTDHGISHYWSYPGASGLRWVERRSDGALGIVEEVPPSVRDATPPRDAHKMRHGAAPRELVPLARRSRPAHATWVPAKAVPACSFHEAWHEQTSFDVAVEHYGATVTRGSWAGPGCRCSYIQLTSGRYACLESRRDFPQTVIIALEVDTRGAGSNTGGKVYVRDIEEVLFPMGGHFRMPGARLFIAWCTDP